MRSAEYTLFYKDMNSPFCLLAFLAVYLWLCLTDV